MQNMKYFYFLIAVLMLVSFKTIQQHYKDNDRALFDLIKKIEQDPGNKSAARSLSETYENLKQSHLQNIFDLKDNADLASHETTLNEYKSLQSMYEAIEKSPVATQLVTAADYSVVIAQLSEQLAAEYYKQGSAYLSLNGRKNKTKAYNNLKNANDLVANYKDSQSKMTKAWEESHISIFINPLKYNIATEELGIDNYQTVTKEMPRQIVSYLGEKFANRYNAKIFSVQSATDKLTTDWVVSISLTDLKISGPATIYSSTTPNFRSDIKDQTGATVIDPQKSDGYLGTIAMVNSADDYKTLISSNGRMKLTITDKITGKTIATALLFNSYKWEKKGAERLVDYRENIAPDNETVTKELLQKFIPDIANVISDALQK